MIFSVFLLAIKKRRKSVAVCPEKNRSLVNISPDPKICTKGSFNEIIPAGGFKGRRYIAAVLNKTNTRYDCMAVKNRWGSFMK